MKTKFVLLTIVLLFVFCICIICSIFLLSILIQSGYEGDTSLEAEILKSDNLKEIDWINDINVDPSYDTKPRLNSLCKEDDVLKLRYTIGFIAGFEDALRGNTTQDYYIKSIDPDNGRTLNEIRSTFSEVNKSCNDYEDNSSYRIENNYEFNSNNSRKIFNSNQIVIYENEQKIFHFDFKQNIDGEYDINTRYAKIIRNKLILPICKMEDLTLIELSLDNNLEDNRNLCKFSNGDSYQIAIFDINQEELIFLSEVNQPILNSEFGLVKYNDDLIFATLYGSVFRITDIF